MVSSVSALSVVPLQLCPGFGPGCPHCSLQAEKQQRPHVAGGRHSGGIWQKGDGFVETGEMICTDVY